MKIVLALLLSFGQITRAKNLDPLERALRGLRKNVEFVDLTPEGRFKNHGADYVVAGLWGLSAVLTPTDAIPGPLAVIGVGVGAISVVAAGVGSVMYVVGSTVGLVSPRPKLAMATSEYTTAAGLNQFMRLRPREQYARAAADPEFADFLIRLDEAYKLAREYRLIPSEDAAF